MARQFAHIIEEPHACAYLPDQSAQLENRLMLDVSPEELQHLLERGWRRFGAVYFRPACAACTRCLPTRVPTARYVPTRSQARALKRAAHLRVEVGPPKVDEARLRLHDLWHQERVLRRGWTPSSITEREYFETFAFPHPCVREVALWDEDRLVGLGIADVTPEAWSAVYFFYDPSDRRLSLGTANVALQIELARERGIPYVYLGYRVDGCASLRYKGAFQPQERLVGRPDLPERAVWEEGDPPATIEPR
jgi:arginine-tRNA-protein transferase